MSGKKWYRSRTLWVNLLLFVGVAVAEFTGSDLLDAEAQAGIITGVNVILRLLTKTGLEV